MPPFIENKYEQLDALLDRIVLNGQEDFLMNLQSIRVAADAAYDSGELAQYEWKALVTRSAKIQEMIGESHETV